MYFHNLHLYSSQNETQLLNWKSFISESWKPQRKNNSPYTLKIRTFSINIILSFCLVLNLFIFSAGIFRSAAAGQGHENCNMCHRAHSAKDTALFPESIKHTIINPHTGKEMHKIDALCMVCHAGPPNGKGIKEINPNKKHPFGIKPVLVNLPDQAKGYGGQTEILSCMGCHDPHPSNQNLSYLRVPSGIKISKKKHVIKSCLWCHPNMKDVFDYLPKKR